MDSLRVSSVTDLVMFSHGWNNDEAAASALYAKWFDLLNAQLGPDRKVGFVGIRWPSQLWRDVPIPDFDPTPGGAVPGAAGLDDTPTADGAEPTLSPQQLQDLKTLFPQGADELDKISSLLAADPNQDGVDKLFAAMQKFNDAVTVESTDGEAPESKRPGMLQKGKTANEVFGAYANALIASGVDIAGGGGGGGAGLGDQAREALAGRQGGAARIVLLADEEPRRRGRPARSRPADRTDCHRIPDVANPPGGAQLRRPRRLLRIGRLACPRPVAGQVGHPP